MKLTQIIKESREAELVKAFDALFGRIPGVFVEPKSGYIQTDYAGRRVSKEQILGLLTAAGLELDRMDEREPEPGEHKGYLRYYYK